MDPIAATDYRDVVQVGAPRLSPDGTQVAFVHKVADDDESYESTVHLVPADGGEPRRFTAGPEDSQPRWSPDGERLAFVRTDGEAPPQVHVIPADGGEARQVTDVAGGVTDLTWSPDGERLAFAQRATPTEREAGHDLDAPDEYEREPPDPRVVDRMVYRAHEQYFDGARSHVYVVDLAAESVERVTDGEADHVSPAWRDERTVYYAVKRGETPDDSVEYDIDAHDVETDERETVTTTTCWEPDLSASADGVLAYRYTPEPVSLRQTDLEVYDPETDETTRPTADFDRTVGDVAPRWADGRLHFVAPNEGAHTVCRTDPGAGTVEILVGEGHAAGVDAAGGTVAFVRSAWDHRGDVFVYEGGAVRRLTEVNADYLERHEVRDPEAITFAVEGQEIQGWLLTPDGEGPHPLVVEIHGGPHAMWSTSGTMWHEFQTLAARGYAVFWCNPRGSTGSGEAFAAAIERDWGATTAADVLAGVEAVCERDAVDETEVHVTGGSFGGFMTAWLVARDDRFRSAVAQRGVYELNSFYGTTDAFELVEGDFDARPWEDHGFLWEQSPAANVGAVDTPTLLVHAENDFRVPVSQAELLSLSLRKGDADTRLVRYPREGHELSRSGEPAHVVDRLERIVRWFDGYSDHHDAPRALERGDEGLSSGVGDEE